MRVNDNNGIAAVAGFTPGPWNTGEASWNEDGDVRYTLHGVKEAKVADCQLIAAAPLLMAALERCYDFFRMSEVDSSISLQVGMALSKARGES